MKSYNQFIKESKSNIESICEKYYISNYTINSDGSIDVDDNVYLNFYKLKVLPLKFRNVTGNFHCDNMKLISLEGCPESVGGHFFCDNNELTSLQGCPQIIGDSFDCSFNDIKDFKGISEFFEGDFKCEGNQIDEIYFLFGSSKCIKWINEFDVIQGNSVILDRLEEVFHQLNMEFMIHTLRIYTNKTTYEII